MTEQLERVTMYVFNHWLKMQGYTSMLGIPLLDPDSNVTCYMGIYSLAILEQTYL